MSATSNSRLQIDPLTELPSIHDFGDLSQFLHSAITDEESLQLADGMGGLATGVETVLSGLKRAPEPAVLAPVLMDLMIILREHRALVIALSPAWRGLYEYASYLAVLNNFRVLIEQWLLVFARVVGPEAGGSVFGDSVNTVHILFGLRALRQVQDRPSAG